MDRRSFLKTSALGGTAAAASTLAAPVYAQGKKTLTMVTSWPRGFAVLDDAASYMEKFVSELSDGNLTIEKKAPGELVGALEVFDAVSSGQADVPLSRLLFHRPAPCIRLFHRCSVRWHRAGTGELVLPWWRSGAA